MSFKTSKTGLLFSNPTLFESLNFGQSVIAPLLEDNILGPPFTCAKLKSWMEEPKQLRFFAVGCTDTKFKEKKKRTQEGNKKRSWILKIIFRE